MQSAYTAPALATPSGESLSGETRTITMGRNRLNTIENWVKPPKPSRSRALGAERSERAVMERGLNEPPRAPETAGLPRPVSQFVRTTTLAAPR
jgi:hypothetical protein